jgi:hypothetical protein
MKLFPKTPALTAKDRERLDAAGYLQSWNKFVAKINEAEPLEDDLKRLVVLELEREAPRAAILEKLVVRIQKKERETIFARIRETEGGQRAMKNVLSLANG